MTLGRTLDRKSPALALSGGGFRATLFHSGALIRLNAEGLLSRIVRFSSVSGGSITTGMLAAAWPRLIWSDGVARNLDEAVIAPLQAFCRLPIDTTAIGLGTILPGRNVGSALADAYEQLYGGISLQTLPDQPQFVFNATNLLTGRLVRLQKSRLTDYMIGAIVDPDIRLAVAVAASSAFPPVLSPVTLSVKPEAWQKLEGAVHFGDMAFMRNLSLTDGGVYDNLGLETVDDFDPVIVSDAGAPFSTEGGANAFWPKQAMRALDIATDQARALRKRLLFLQSRQEGRVAIYAGIDSSPADYPATSGIATSDGLRLQLARMRTRLNPFSDLEQKRLINWGWLIMDLALRSFLPGADQVQGRLPFPKVPLQ